MAIYKNTPPIVTNGLVLHLDAGNRMSYPGSGTTWSDLSGNGNNGTLTNGPVYTVQGAQTSFTFDGVNDYTNLGDTTSLQFGTGNFTISMWVQLPNIDIVGSIIAKRQAVGPFNLIVIQRGTAVQQGNGYDLNASKKITVGIRANDSNQYVATTVNDIADGGWKHIVLTRTSTSVFLYINNIQQNTSVLYNLGTSTQSDISIPGSIWQTAGLGDINFFFISCSIASTQLYNRALSASEIAQNYNALKSRFGLT